MHWGFGVIPCDTHTTHTYSPTGQLTRIQRPNHQTDYTYNATDRLHHITQNGQERATYRYDPFGRRIAKTVNGTTTYYLYANEGLIAELNSQGQLTRAYGWQPNTPYGTAPLWQAEVSGTTWQFHYFQTDHLGTPKLATNPKVRSLGRLRRKPSDRPPLIRTVP